ncbi:MAG: mechanosensitive ion channel [Solirubrobacterales bacterium]|nr:mechanosensitive ion channel [Solirubrobacterales bacterium]
MHQVAKVGSIGSVEQTFWDSNGDWIAALISLAVAFAIAFVVDRFVIARATRVAGRVSETTMSRGVRTRLRMIRRLVFVAIIVVGVGVALSQFDRLDKLATGILASSAVLGIVLGLAARQVLANPLAGILLAVSRPIRIGDTVTIAEETGRVDDLTLSHTFIDTGDGRLVIVPNEIVVTNVVVNRSTGDLTAPVMASIWVPTDADVGRAREALARLEPSQVEVAEMTPDGIRIEIHGPRRPGGTRASGEEAAMRERALRALREAGVLGRASE